MPWLRTTLYGAIPRKKYYSLAFIWIVSFLVKVRTTLCHIINSTTWKYCCLQGCCLRYESGRLKFSSRSSGGRLNIHPICPVTSIFSRNRSKNHSHNKFNRKTLPLWSCFAFVTRNTDQNTATKFLYAHKTAETAAVENRPIMHCKFSIE